MKCILLCIILAAVTVFCSCKPDDVIEVGFSTEIAESSTAVQPSETEKPEPVISSEKESLPVSKKESVPSSPLHITQVIYPEMNAATTRMPAYAPETHIADVDALPDILGSPIKDLTQIPYQDGYAVEELGLLLSITEDYNLFRMPGLYMNAEGKCVLLEFVSEYVLTDKDITKDQILKDLARLKTISYPEAPAYMLMSFRVFNKDYFPIEALFRPVLNASNEYRRTEELCCNTGYVQPYQNDRKTEQTVQKILHQIAANTEGNGIWYQSDLDPYTAGQFPFFMYNEPELFRSDLIQRRVSDQGSERILYFSDPDCSVLNDTWWNSYEAALGMLKEDPESYANPEMDIQFKNVSGMEMQDSGWKAYNRSVLNGWKKDPDNDQQLRAWFYASAEQNGYRVAIEDIMIYLNEAEEGKEVYYALAVNPGNNEVLANGERIPIVEVLGRGADILAETDLAFAREYAKKYLKKDY